MEEELAVSQFRRFIKNGINRNIEMKNKEKRTKGNERVVK